MGEKRKWNFHVAQIKENLCVEATKKIKIRKDTYLQLLDELQLLPSIQQFPIPTSSPLGLQALYEKL